MKKKIVVLLLFLIQYSFAQQSTEGSPLYNKKNEIRTDLLATAFTRFNLTYERFISPRFSLGVTGIYANSKRLQDDFDEGNIDSFTQYEVIPFVRYNLSKGQRSFYFAEIFTDINGGEYREIKLLTNTTNNSYYYAIEKSRFTDLALGASVGYKYYIQDQFGIEFLVGFGENLFNADKSLDIMSRVGLSVGYRF